ncbi:hypothetical protein M2447_001816 [Ereboglobus sp. PH5-10]|uniref:DUF3999 family protein n=1 Tax=Ereboglobus sp. PH5-10 TaxID=2940629 RepID=UPI002407600D|nr:DUF3999 family protein [Ereboglobus sp. PH5-10]MDF9827717.1 hypothetical protein [Ereboglobus sp. PH5-10]
MKKLLALIPALFVFGATAHGLNQADWECRQSFDVAQAGPARVSVPIDTLGRARADLRDLRIVGPDGAELPYAMLALPDARAAYRVSQTVAPRAFGAALDGAATVVTIETGVDKPLESIELSIPDAKDYMKPARVEVSPDRKNWTTVAGGQPLFRRNQAGRYDAVAQNTLPLGGRAAAFVRVTIYDQGHEPIAVAGAKLRVVDEVAARDTVPDEEVATTITNVKQLADETVLTVDLGAANLRLTSLSLAVGDSLFARSVTVTLPAAGDDTADRENTLARNRPVYSRTSIGGIETSGRTTVALDGASVPSRTILVRIANGDSPPLDIRGVAATRRPAHLAFNPSVAGRHTFLSGNPQAAAPRYDIAMLSRELARLPLTEIAAGTLVATPDYRAPAAPAEPSQITTRILFWVALAVTVGVLLYVIGRLLPKTDK